MFGSGGGGAAAAAAAAAVEPSVGEDEMDPEFLQSVLQNVKGAQANRGVLCLTLQLFVCASPELTGHF